MSLSPLFSRIVARILLINALIVFLPIGALLFLDTYEDQMLRSLERSLVSQGRTLAAALSASNAPLAEQSRETLMALSAQTESRLRVIDADGALLADSSTVKRATAPDAGSASRIRSGADTRAEAAAPAEGAPVRSPRSTLLYRLASFPVRMARDLFGRPETPLPSADFYSAAEYAAGSEVQAALAGTYGAATRVSAGGQISMTLYSALPIERDDVVVGAVLVSQSTFRILQDLYQLRIDLFEIFLWTMLAALVISAFLSLTIAHPIAQLQKRAQEAVDERGRLRAPMPPAKRADEIGGLSRALYTLTARIDHYTTGLENFAADASHELKNPLASIRANAELAADTKDDERRARFLSRIESDVHRALTIINGMRELSHIDAERESVSRCRPAAVLQELSEQWNKHRDLPRVLLRIDAEAVDVEVGLSATRMGQIAENLVQNARSFAPAGSEVEVELRRGTGKQEGGVVLTVSDRGPGFGTNEIGRVFDRFYSSRADSDHLGLGLSIVKAITERAGGTVGAANREGGGALVAVRLERLSERRRHAVKS
ncbi:MAG: ATP-binding protein [Spirochaetales bacterium]